MREQPVNGFALTILVLLAVFFLLTPFMARSLQGNDSLLGEQSYFHLGVAQNLLEPGSYPLPEVTHNLFDFLIMGTLLVLKPLFSSKLIPLLFGIGSVILFFLSVQRLLDDVEGRAVAGLLFVISPLFLVVFSTLMPAAFVLFLSMLAWWLYDRSPIASGAVLLLLVGVDAKAFVVMSLLLVAYGLLRSSWRPAAISGAVGLFIMMFLDAFLDFVARDAILGASSLNDFFVSLGSSFGYSFFILFLALIGAMQSWSKERKSLLASLIIVGLFVFSFSDLLTRVMLLPVAALLAGKGLLFLLRRPWAVKSIRNGTLFLIGLSLLFTLIMTISGQVESEPSMEKLEALRFLHTAPDDAVVLSSSENGIFIERVGRREAFLDNVDVADPERVDHEALSQQLFYSQRMEDTAPLLVEHGITHILVDDAMRDGGVWTYEEQGLLFLLKYDDRFVELYENKGVSVYLFIGS